MHLVTLALSKQCGDLLARMGSNCSLFELMRMCYLRICTKARALWWMSAASAISLSGSAFVATSWNMLLPMQPLRPQVQTCHPASICWFGPGVLKNGACGTSIHSGTTTAAANAGLVSLSLQSSAPRTLSKLGKHCPCPLQVLGCTATAMLQISLPPLPTCPIFLPTRLHELGQLIGSSSVLATPPTSSSVLWMGWFPL